MEYGTLPLYLIEVALLPGPSPGQRCAGLRNLNTEHYLHVPLPFPDSHLEGCAARYLEHLNVSVIGHVNSAGTYYFVTNKPLP